jgi:pyridoxal phosphate enzyme (YggS family)
MMISESVLKANLRAVRLRLEAAARRAGRSPDEIRIIAVTKGHPPDLVRLAYDSGLRDFGENRVEEARSKQSQLSDLKEARWHMIGHIQSRKAKDVVGAFVLVHSVDRARIAATLDRLGCERGLRLPVLLECNLSGEASKDGWDASRGRGRPDLLADLLAVTRLPSLDVQGMMTMAPWTSDIPLLRRVFSGLVQLRDELRAAGAGPLPELSMGMTDDFEIAIGEGATMVRIGRALFGERPTGADLAGLAYRRASPR